MIKESPYIFVFVGDDQHRSAVFSDSFGNFSIPVYPDSKLKFELRGYEDMLIDALQPFPVMMPGFGIISYICNVGPLQHSVIHAQPRDYFPGQHDGFLTLKAFFFSDHTASIFEW